MSSHASRPSHLIALLAVVACVALTPRPAAASTINWRIFMTVHGNGVGFPPGFIPLPGDAPQPFTIPNGTPMIVDLSFDSNTPNTCPPGTGGVYNIGGASGNTASMHFLGADFGAFGGIESGVLGPCGGAALFAGLRLFVSSQSPIQFIPTPGFGNFFITLPNPSVVSGLPTVLPTDPFISGASHFGDANQLVFESVQIRTVPEPATLLLVAAGGVLTAFRRRRKTTAID